MKLQDQIDKVTATHKELHDRIESVNRKNYKAETRSLSADVGVEVYILAGMIKNEQTDKIILFALLMIMCILSVIK